jgi:hypothetical protein
MPDLPAEMSAAEYRVWQVRQYDEATWQAWVEREAVEHGWLVFHDRDSRRNTAGFPDCCICHPAHGVIFLELKTETGRVRRAQKRWLATLQAAGERAYVARPRDVEAVLRLLAGHDVWIGPRFVLDRC